jgi:hypothetical protein
MTRIKRTKSKTFDENVEYLENVYLFMNEIKVIISGGNANIA